MMRLVNGASTTAGRLEVYFNGQWGTVCDDGWSLDEATVVCRQLGLGDAQEATHNASFGPGTGDILLGNVSCSGNEDTLMDCSHPPVGTHHCTHMEDAGVICRAQASIRLSGGAVDHEGRVELFYNSVWGTVCHGGWDLNDAKVACRQLGFPGALSYTTHAAYGGGTGLVLLNNVACVGNEADLWSCGHAGVGSFWCGHGSDAGVVCSPSDIEDPEVSCPNSVPSQDTDLGMSSAVVTWTPMPSATDNVDNFTINDITCQDEAGNVVESDGTYSLGTTTVTCLVFDSAHNKGSCKFVIHVVGEFCSNI
ncbi:deleted in malignant brain tumors 1 protein-like [Patiria miniata]|uniref:Deleted in malignant brain tumors 1 protein-like n=1 Tax=Patiria miniata TaxID=46514 RepID=A0A914AB64_PATMI|nr:deleted in malignant brain tumors 1 protein-like [Patiria miniata]